MLPTPLSSPDDDSIALCSLDRLVHCVHRPGGGYFKMYVVVLLLHVSNV